MFSHSLIRNLRRGRRRLARLAGPPGVRFVYSRRYQVELPGALYDPRRGERILGALDAAGLLDWTAVQRAAPVPFRHLRRIHTDDYLDSLTQPGALQRIVGLEIPEEVAERLLESQRTMVGGTLLATRLALEERRVAVNLGGGLHHAFPSRGERFCVYNDVAAAVADLRARGEAETRVLIVDLDMHDGDGTRAILANDPAVHHFTIHNRTSPGVKAREETVVELGHYVEDETYLEAIRSRLPQVFESFQPDLVFYLAGTDPAADDQIGDWRISAEALLARDLLVLSCAREHDRKLPLVILLAGGYGINSWRYSARFLSALLNRGKPVEPPTTEELILLRYRNMAREFEEHELTGEAPRPVDDWGLSEDDLFSALGGPRRPQRMLGFYSRQGLELALERAGLFDRVRSLGFERPLLELDVENPAGDTVRLYGDPSKQELLIEVRLRLDRRSVQDMALLSIEWLLLQNPRARFTPDRPQLPGQNHPGLGMLHDIIALLVLVCDRLQLDGLIFVPSHYHVASHGRKTMRFLKPEDEGLYRAFESAFRDAPLSLAAEAVLAGRVIDARTGEPCVWQPVPMVFPVSDRLKERVQGEEYEKKVAAEVARHELVVR